MSLVARILEEAGIPTVILGSAIDIVEHCGVPRFLFTDHLSWDKDNTHTRDIPSFLPIGQLQQLVDEGVVGELGPRFYCVPTEYSKRNTREADAPRILELCQQDQIDLALLVPL